MNRVRTPCRSCGHLRLDLVVSLGQLPLAGRLLTEEMLAQPEPWYPLTLLFCPNCSLVQIAETISLRESPPEGHPDSSRSSPEVSGRPRENAERLIKSRALGPDSLVVRIGGNDGYMLKSFKEQGIPTLGIDAPYTFLTKKLALELRDQGRQADLIIANNVLAHVGDPNGLVAGIRVLLRDTGLAVLEVPYVREVIDNCRFDRIDHQHLCYFSVSSLDHLFRRHSLFLNDIEQLPIHGGSLRLYLSGELVAGSAVQALLERETAAGMHQFGYYRDFAGQAAEVRRALLELVRTLKCDGRSLAAYGAAAKGASLINYVGLGTEFIDFVVDHNPQKHGRYLPGQHIPVYACEKLLSAAPDYVLLLARDFAEEIIRQNAEYLRRGGAFIIPLPSPHIIRGVEQAIASA